MYFCTIETAIMPSRLKNEKMTKLFISAKNFNDVEIVNPSAKFGKKNTNICSYFYEQNEQNKKPTVEELLAEIRPHFKGNVDYSHIEIGGVNYDM